MLSDKAFEIALLAAQPALLSYAKKLTRDRDRAEDLLQDANLKLWSKRSYYTDGNFLSWCRVVMRNGFLNQIEIANRMKYTDSSWASGATAITEDSESNRYSQDALMHKYLCTEPNQEDFWLENRINEVIATLPPHTALLITLKLQGLNYTQIGKALGIKANNAKQRYFNDIKTLRALLLRKGLVDDLN